MGNRLLDLTGRTFERLSVLGRAEKPAHIEGFHTSWWRCKCVCGKEKVIAAVSLKTGNTRSCGCLHAESMRAYYARRRVAR
jgi:hypothetical protein